MSGYAVGATHRVAPTVRSRRMFGLVERPLAGAMTRISSELNASSENVL